MIRVKDFMIFDIIGRAVSVHNCVFKMQTYD